MEKKASRKVRVLARRWAVIEDWTERRFGMTRSWVVIGDWTERRFHIMARSWAVIGDWTERRFGLVAGEAKTMQMPFPFLLLECHQASSSALFKMRAADEGWAWQTHWSFIDLFTTLGFWTYVLLFCAVEGMIILCIGAHVVCMPIGALLSLTEVLNLFLILFSVRFAHVYMPHHFF